MSNPYQISGASVPSQQASSEVNGPAISLIVISLIGIIVGLLGLAGDAFLWFSGMVDQIEAAEQGPAAKTQIIVRTVWGIVLLVAASFVLMGALKMKNLSNHAFASTAAIVAVIPMVGPCCILGIPFGIWALVVLNRPHVKNAFQS